jgi:hypothetical protein
MVLFLISQTNTTTITAVPLPLFSLQIKAFHSLLLQFPDGPSLVDWIVCQQKTAKLLGYRFSINTINI